jgi:hypothetical protein
MDFFTRVIDIKALSMILLALFGILSLFRHIMRQFIKKNVNRKLDAIVFVKNSQDYIEGIVRNYYITHFKDLGELLIIDGGSVDNTREIIQRLACQYSGISIMLFANKDFKECICEGLNYIAGPEVLIINATYLDIKQEEFTNHNNSPKNCRNRSKTPLN